MAEQFFEAVKAVRLEVAGICLVLAVFELLSCIIRLCKDTNDVIIKYQGCASLSIFYLSTVGADKALGVEFVSHGCDDSPLHISS